MSTGHYLVTGAAGFIGSRIARALCDRGDQVTAVDSLEDGRKIRNLAEVPIVDYFDRRELLDELQKPSFLNRFNGVFHQGACSATTEWNGRFMMDVNFSYSKNVLHACLDAGIPLVYASSASVYGLSSSFQEEPRNERPLNPYAFSKLCFDRYMRAQVAADKPVWGLRYFNAYGPGESHKGDMASVIYHFFGQLKRDGIVKLFKGSGGFDDGEQKRDFVFVDDVVAVNLWIMDERPARQVLNVGTGTARSFNEVAKILIEQLGAGQIAYIPFPDRLQGAYQHATQADISALRSAGYRTPFTSLEEGIGQYLASFLAEHFRAGCADSGPKTRR